MRKNVKIKKLNKKINAISSEIYLVIIFILLFRFGIFTNYIIKAKNGQGNFKDIVDCRLSVDKTMSGGRWQVPGETIFRILDLEFFEFEDKI